MQPEVPFEYLKTPLGRDTRETSPSVYHRPYVKDIPAGKKDQLERVDLGIFYLATVRRPRAIVSSSCPAPRPLPDLLLVPLWPTPPVVLSPRFASSFSVHRQEGCSFVARQNLGRVSLSTYFFPSFSTILDETRTSYNSWIRGTRVSLDRRLYRSSTREKHDRVTINETTRVVCFDDLTSWRKRVARSDGEIDGSYWKIVVSNRANRFRVFDC